MNFAVVYTVKNEERLLAKALSHWSKCGCARVYVYLDGANEATRNIAYSHSIATVHDTVDYRALDNPPEWVLDIGPRQSKNMDVRKRVNTLHALRSAKNLGLDWLICIDPDEILLPNKDVPEFGATTIAEFLSNLPSGTMQVLAPNHDVLPGIDDIDDPFRSCEYFQKRFKIIDVVDKALRYSMRLAHFPVQTRNQCSSTLYKRVLGCDYPRSYKSLCGKSLVWPEYYMGYRNHKSILSTSVVTEPNFNIHYWDRGQILGRTIKKGAIFHYDYYSPSAVWNKFRQRPAVNAHNSGGARDYIAKVARTKDYEEFREFYISYVAIDNTSVAGREIADRIYFRNSSIADFLRRG